MSWNVKLFICLLVDAVDFLLGRLAIGFPVGEILGTIIVTALFGWRGLFYLLELLDPTEQIDAFVPAATLIALTMRKRATDMV